MVCSSSERNRPIFASVSVFRLMGMRGSVPPSTRVAGLQRLERPLRLATGLTLFAFATTHLLNHAFGIRSAAAMHAAGAVLLAPWQTYVGLTLLYGSLLTHGSLGLLALFRRRHLRLPRGEAWQLGLGLTI